MGEHRHGNAEGEREIERREREKVIQMPWELHDEEPKRRFEPRRNGVPKAMRGRRK